MIRDKIIISVTEPTEFVNPVVLVRKPDNSIRLCLDPMYLNKSLLREHYELLTYEEITWNLSGSSVFTKLDANKGFWQIQLTDSSSMLTTFATPFGRYRFLRLPYGLVNSPEIFYRTYSEIFDGIEGVKVFIDEIIIFSKDIESHKLILKQVFESI